MCKFSSIVNRGTITILLLLTALILCVSCSGKDSTRFTSHELDLICDLWHQADFSDTTAERFWKNQYSDWVSLDDILSVKGVCRDAPLIWNFKGNFTVEEIKELVNGQN